MVVFENIVVPIGGSGSTDDRPIGIFDSGVGGLTVMESIMRLLPQEHLIYFGDTARFPYGPRPIEQIRQFALQIVRVMLEQDVKMLVVACNSMTAALRGVELPVGHPPLVGVIEPAVRKAVRATHNRRIGVLGTKATIASKEYERALDRTKQNVDIYPVVCSGFVDHVEQGDTFSEELFALAEEYLAPLKASGVDTLILGCTHYPMLTGVLHTVTRGQVEIISSADEVAKEVFETLRDKGLLRMARQKGTRRFVVSGDADQFASVGSLFLAGLGPVEGRPWPIDPPEEQLA